MDENKPISKGDLVQVVRGHHCWLGRIFEVLNAIPSYSYALGCTNCFSVNTIELVLIEVNQEGVHGRYAPLAWLKRIPPLEELDKLILDIENEITV